MLTCTLGLLSGIVEWDSISIHHPQILRPWNPKRATEEEVDLVSRSFGGKFALRDKALFVLGTYSGFRITELLSLRIKDVQQFGQIVDRVTVQRRHMKRKTQSRSVVLHPVAKVALLEWFGVMDKLFEVTPDTYIFQSRKAKTKRSPASRRFTFSGKHLRAVR